jgi:PAS domain S-box-containing protein
MHQHPSHQGVALPAQVQPSLALVEAHDLLVNVLDSATEYGIVALDVERRILLWNPGARRCYGHPAEQVMGRRADLLHPKLERGSGRLQALFDHALSEGRAAAVMRALRADGSTFTARVVVTRRNDPSGVPVGFLMISRDVTEESRRVAEQSFLAGLGAATGESLDYHQTLACITRAAARELADFVILDLCAADGEFERVSVAHKAPAGAAIAQALGRIQPRRDKPHLSWAVLDSGRPLLMSPIPASYLHDLAHSSEHLQLLESIGAVSLLAFPLIAHGRSLGAILLISCDVEHRFGPMDLQFGEEVAHRAALAVDNARLYRTAQQALGTRDEVLAFVAHDLRSPLNAIRLNAEALERQLEEGHSGRKKAARIQRSVDTADRLIKELLEVSREAVTRTAALQWVMPQILAADALEEAESLAREAGVILSSDVAQHAPPLKVQRARVLRALGNLLGNALKFTPRGGRVHLVVAPRTDEVVFSVSDTGPGIAAEDQPRIFQRFWQVTPGDVRGAGLGLSIARAFVEEHGGRLWVDSEPGAGSTFSFSLPSQRAGPPLPLQAAQAQP